MPCSQKWLPLIVNLCMLKVQCSEDASGNYGTEFVLGFMEIPEADSLYVILQITGYKDSVILITSPSWISNSYPVVNISELLIDQEVLTITLSSNTWPSNSTIIGQCLHINSTNPISVVGINVGLLTGESFLAFPVQSLGMEYYAVTWCEEKATCQIGIIATEDDTTVTVAPPSGVTIIDFDSLETNIDKYSFLVLNSSQDLTGTKISSTKPIVVYGGAITTQVGNDNNTAWNHLVEQLPPVKAWGKMFVVFADPINKAGSFIRIVTKGDKPRLEISGKSAFVAVDKWIQLRVLYTESYLITSSSSILVCMFSSGERSVDQASSHPSMLIYQPVEQFITTTNVHIYPKLSEATIYLTVVYNSGDRRPSCFPNNGSMTEYEVSGTKFIVSSFTDDDNVNCTFSSPVGVYIHGYNDTATLSHMAETSLRNILTECLQFPVIDSAAISDICTEGVEDRWNDNRYTWIGGDILGVLFYIPSLVELKGVGIFVYGEAILLKIGSSEEINYTDNLFISQQIMNIGTHRGERIIAEGTSPRVSLHLGFEGKGRGFSVIYPANILGFDHFLVTWCETGMCQCDALAIDNHTLVAIHIKVTNSSGYATVNGNLVLNNNSIEIRVDELDVINITSNNDLTGTRIQSSAPLAVFCYIRIINQLDTAIQILPVDKLHGQYSTLEFYNNTAGSLRFVATTDKTIITTPDVVIFLNAGDFHDYVMEFNKVDRIHGNNRFIAIQKLWNIDNSESNVDPIFFLPSYSFVNNSILYSVGKDSILKVDYFEKDNTRLSKLGTSEEIFLNETLHKQLDPDSKYKLEFLGIVSRLAYIYRKQQFDDAWDYTFVQIVNAKFYPSYLCNYKLEHGNDVDCDNKGAEENCYPDYPLTDYDFDGRFGEDCQPVHGGLSCWNEWTNCTGACGDEIRQRSRSCDSPSPKYNGDTCDNNTEQSEPCPSRTSCPDTTITSSSITDSQNTTAPTPASGCPCKCSEYERLMEMLRFRNLNETDKLSELNDKIAEMKKTMKINKKETAAYIATKVSATDERSSSTYMGSLGIFLLVSLMLVILILDFPTLAGDFAILRENLFQSFSTKP